MGYADPELVERLVRSKLLIQQADDLLTKMNDPALQGVRTYSPEEETSFLLAAKLLRAPRIDIARSIAEHLRRAGFDAYLLEPDGSSTVR